MSFYLYPPTLLTNWSEQSYSIDDTNLIFSSWFKVVYEISKVITQPEVFKGTTFEIIDHRDYELQQYNAIGLAWYDGVKVYVPPNLSMLEMTANSGVMSMEIAHEFWARTFGNEDRQGWNDVIHWLYNTGRLLVKEYVNELNIKRYGQSIKVIVPDLAYGIAHRKEIMEGIRSGRYREGANEYWADPAVNKSLGIVAAESHELHIIENWLSKQVY